MSGKPTTRRVTVMLMNSRQHVELVETETPVIMGGTIDKVEFKCVTQDVETAARNIMRDKGMDVDDFEVVGVLVSCLYGPLAGRIVWATEATMTVTTKTKLS